MLTFAQALHKYREGQARDERGRFASDGGGKTSTRAELETRHQAVFGYRPNKSMSGKKIRQKLEDMERHEQYQRVKLQRVDVAMGVSRQERGKLDTEQLVRDLNHHVGKEGNGFDQAFERLKKLPKAQVAEVSRGMLSYPPPPSSSKARWLEDVYSQHKAGLSFDRHQRATRGRTAG